LGMPASHCSHWPDTPEQLIVDMGALADGGTVYHPGPNRIASTPAYFRISVAIGTSAKENSVPRGLMVTVIVNSSLEWKFGRMERAARS